MALYSSSEQSPFAILCDELYYALTKYLSFEDILSVAEASFHFNQYATKYVLPQYTTLDFHNPQNFPVSGSSFSVDQLNRILSKIAPHVRRVELNTNFSQVDVSSSFLSTISSKCTNLEEIVLHDFGSDGEFLIESLPSVKHLRFLNCDYMDLPENCNRLPLEELEISGRWFYWPDTNVFFDKLHTLSINRSTIKVHDLQTVLQRNAKTLRCLKLTHIYRLEEYDTASFWHELPGLVPNVTDISVCGREIRHLTHGNFERLEVDQPLEGWLIDLLPRFPRLRCFAANYTSNFESPVFFNAIEQDKQMLRDCVNRLVQLGTLSELHLIVDNPELLYSIQKTINEVVVPNNGSHLHVFVYGRSKPRNCRGEVKCQFPLSGTYVRKCNQTNLVDQVSNNRCEMQQDLSNILYEDDD